MKIWEKLGKVLVAVITTALLFTGCGSASDESNSSYGKDKDELVIYVGHGMTDGGYDPTIGFGITGGLNIFHSTLLKFDKNINLQNDLAADYSISDDGLKYTFKLRKDVKFSDGQPLTAEDVVFTYLTAKNSGSSVDLTMLKSAVAKDKYTVEFTLNRKYSPFTSTTALLGIVPKHAYNKDSYADNPIGSGPFKVAQLDKGQQLILVPNEYYYGEKSKFKKITILELDEDAALASAKSGQLDVVMINPEYAKEKVKGMHLERLKTVDNRGINLPVIPEKTLKDGTIIGNNVTCDLAIRKALNIGIDRKTIIQNALNGIGVPAYGEVDGLPWFNEETVFEDNRVDEAIKILEEAGWVDTDNDGIREKNGIKAEFTITGRTDDLQRYNLAVALSEDAKKLGINIKAEAKAWDECKKIVRNVPTVYGSGSYSPIALHDTNYSKLEPVGLLNISSYKNEKVDSYIEKALDATTIEEAIKNWKLAQWDGATGISVDYPFLWIVNIDHTYFVRDGLDLGDQLIHPHGHGVPIIANLNEWSWK
ncbi:ABC transporter substrate-binding protein [Clostridium thermopalmarium]|uniref:Oligopeptide-binding protein AppA n=1 Tax=Clostridium thermopalmarium DSM 5974 TaxID=1121340 RepID=A0A2T0ATJ3_9CLOT|nr:ABC transporter substrate-binding protein [Clostridium thermopalmarium]PRR73785.1 Oligopeptide-binding protein AppA precursor [Clostridium thermopalmarium DSM 5974]PVZ21164.1 peptide/nickel transport system substrate-binding protein [Clostridium thermopalmarium DSM 5974]